MKKSEDTLKANLVIFNPFSLNDENNKILTQFIEPKDYSEKEKRLQLFEILKFNMDYHKGAGLAANQIALNERAFISKNKIYFNPLIINVSKEEEDSIEGCLSFPSVEAKIKRHSEITVEYINIEGETIKETLTGFEAIVFQHEIDHINGITLHERIKGSLAKKRFMEKYKKSLKNQRKK